MAVPGKTDLRTALNEKDGKDVWWRLLRPHTLTASFIPVFIGSMLAYAETSSLHIPLFLVMLLASMLIQAATNMFNEYFDYKRGLDNEHSVGIGGTIVRDRVHPKTVLNLGYLFFFISILLGVYICVTTSWWVAVIGAGSMVIGYLYTGGPLPIAYTPFGELAAGFLMGTVIIGISFFIQTGYITQDLVLISIPTALFIACLLLANNIRDLDGDKKHGRKTIAILLGRPKAILLQTYTFIFIYLLTGFLILFGKLPIWSLLTFLSIIPALNALKQYKGKTTPLELMPAMVLTGKTNTIYGFLLGLSLFLSALF